MPRPGDEPFEIEDAEVMQHGTDAVLVRSEAFEKPEWIPYSQIHDDSEVFEGVKVGEVGKLVVKQWLAEQRGWC